MREKGFWLWMCVFVYKEGMLCACFSLLVFAQYKCPVAKQFQYRNLHFYNLFF